MPPLSPKNVNGERPSFIRETNKAPNLSLPYYKSILQYISVLNLSNLSASYTITYKNKFVLVNYDVKEDS